MVDITSTERPTYRILKNFLSDFEIGYLSAQAGKVSDRSKL